MKIEDFKEDDFITREEPSQLGDRSYLTRKLQLVGVKSGIIALVDHSRSFGCEMITLPTDDWSEGWNYFPSDLIEKANKKVEDSSRISKPHRGKGLDNPILGKVSP